jgi:hypothetical protein
VVFHASDENLVPWLQYGPAVALGDEIDTLGSASGEDHLAGASGINEAGRLLPHIVVGNRGSLAEVVNPTVDIGVLGRVEASDGVDYGLRLLAGCGIIEINEPLAADLLPENREVLADTLDIKRGSGEAREPGSLMW